MKECPEIFDRSNVAHKRGNLVKLDAVQGPRLLIQEPRFTRDEYGTEPQAVEVRDCEQGVLLRPAQFQLGDHMRDREGYSLVPPTQDTPPIAIFLRRSDRFFPWPMASSIEVCSQRPYRPIE